MGYNVNDVYQSNSDFLKADDIGQNFWTATVATVEMKEFDNGERKLAVTFQELDKSLLLNMTNARTVSDLYGGDTDHWVGRQLMLFTAPVDYQGKKVQAIRVRGPAPQQGGPLQNSHQRPLPAGQNNYAKASGGAPGYNEMNPPPPSSAEDYVR